MAAQEGGVGLAYMGAMVLGRARSFLCPAGLAKVFIVGPPYHDRARTCCPFDTYPFAVSVDMLACTCRPGMRCSHIPRFVMYPSCSFCRCSRIIISAASIQG